MVAADHLKVPRQHGLFHHHGIDLGDGTVAHYLEGKEILRSSVQEFCRGEAFEVITHEYGSSKGLTLRRAMSRIGEQNYNLLFNNCEHFANWCKTGHHRSEQMENLFNSSRISAAAIGQIMPAAFLKTVTGLLDQGLIDEKSRGQALYYLEQVDKIRSMLLKKLESTLEKADSWLQNESENIARSKNASRTRALLLNGQKLSDQLTDLENLKSNITDKLNG